MDTAQDQITESEFPDRYSVPIGKLFIFADELQVREFIAKLAFDGPGDIRGLGVLAVEDTLSFDELIELGDDYPDDYNYGPIMYHDTDPNMYADTDDIRYTCHITNKYYFDSADDVKLDPDLWIFDGTPMVCYINVQHGWDRVGDFGIRMVCVSSLSAAHDAPHDYFSLGTTTVESRRKKHEYWCNVERAIDGYPEEQDNE